MHHGRIPVPLDPPVPELVEAVLAWWEPGAGRGWLTSPAGSLVVGGASLCDGFDALPHVPLVTPAAPA